jgi:hypothetical protein
MTDTCPTLSCYRLIFTYFQYVIPQDWEEPWQMGPQW